MFRKLSDFYLFPVMKLSWFLCISYAAACTLTVTDEFNTTTPLLGGFRQAFECAATFNNGLELVAQSDQSWYRSKWANECIDLTLQDSIVFKSYSLQQANLNIVLLFGKSNCQQIDYGIAVPSIQLSTASQWYTLKLDWLTSDQRLNFYGIEIQTLSTTATYFVSGFYLSQGCSITFVYPTPTPATSTSITTITTALSSTTNASPSTVTTFVTTTPATTAVNTQSTMTTSATSTSITTITTAISSTTIANPTTVTTTPATTAVNTQSTMTTSATSTSLTTITTTAISSTTNANPSTLTTTPASTTANSQSAITTRATSSSITTIITTATTRASTSTTTITPTNSFEPPDSTLLIGSWYDPTYISPVQINQRMHQKYAMFQDAAHIAGNTFSQYSIYPRILETGTSAIYYLSVHSNNTPLDTITDSAINQLVNLALQANSKGLRLLIRLFPEMNGNWFAYGQLPTVYVATFRRFVNAIRLAIPTAKFLWSPNMGNGYPYPGGQYAGNAKIDVTAKDTNHNGILDSGDDPYSPYYPGDNYVDWVGLSVYHFGSKYPYVDNVLPSPNFIENTIAASNFNFYQTFAANKGKPFIFSEFGAAFHLNNTQTGQPISPGPGELAMKQALWRQILNSTFLLKYPKVKGLCFFDWIKPEDLTWRDFRVVANPSVYNSLANDFASLPNIKWAV